MNSELDGIKTMYDLMVARYEASPYTRHQAGVYREIRALADECDTLATITHRLQVEGYNAKPMVALVLDKLWAYIRAAEDTGRDDLAAIYQQAYDTIKEDPLQAYMSGYYDEAKQAEIKYAKTVGRLLACFDDFLFFDLRGETEGSVAFHQEEWEKENIFFSEVTNISKLRCHLACDDHYLQRFINEYDSFVGVARKGKPNPSDDEQAEYKQAWNELKGRKTELRELSRREIKKYRSGAVMSIAPAFSDGDYEYIHEVFE